MFILRPLLKGQSTVVPVSSAPDHSDRLETSIQITPILREL